MVERSIRRERELSDVTGQLERANVLPRPRLKDSDRPEQDWHLRVGGLADTCSITENAEPISIRGYSRAFEVGKVSQQAPPCVAGDRASPLRPSGRISRCTRREKARSKKGASRC